MISIIPIMTSNVAPIGVASASSTYDSSRLAWKAFNKNNGDAWLSQYNSSTIQTNQWIKYNLDKPKRVVKYSILALSGTTTEQWQVGTAPKSWRFEASNNGIDWVILDEKTNFNKELWVTNGGYQEFSIVNENFYLIYRLYLVSYQYNGATYFQINELDMYVASEYLLIKNEGNFFNHVNNKFNKLSLVEPLNEGDYFSYGIEDISNIPEIAWSQLQGEVELYYFTDDKNKNEVSFNIETDSFTLSEEWEDKEIKIIEYTDDSMKTESIITIETEQFTLYDELDDNVDVLYYTDDPMKTTADLNITANYSPIDELDGNFDVVTYTNSDRNLILSFEAIPKPVLITQIKDIDIYGGLNQFLIEQSSLNSGIKIIISDDLGYSWKTFKIYGDKKVVYYLDNENLDEIKKHGLSITDFNSITKEEWNNLIQGKKVRFAYYFEQNQISEVAKIDKLISNELCTIKTPELNSIKVLYSAIDEKYYGLMFLDENRNYYSTSIGEIIKYLDFGTLIAGQTSLEVEVKLMNSYNFNVQNIQINNIKNVNGVKVELSKTINPFIAENSLIFEDILLSEEEISFYVRLIIDRNAHTGGSFDIEAKSDPVF